MTHYEIRTFRDMFAVPPSRRSAMLYAISKRLSDDAPPTEVFVWADPLDDQPARIWPDLTPDTVTVLKMAAEHDVEMPEGFAGP
jgi:hypothetical protein